jgi:hypothetical protein
MSFFPLPCYLVPLRLKYISQHLVFKHTQPTVLFQCERPSFKPMQKKTGRIIFLFIIMFLFLDRKLDDKNSAPNDTESHRLTSICSQFLTQYKQTNNITNSTGFIVHMETAAYS